MGSHYRNLLYRGISASGKQSQGIRDGTSPAAAAGFPSVMKISENNAINNELNSKHVSEEFVNKQINQLNVKKATGHNGISPKILKMAQQEITNPITKLVNKSIDSSIFPADLKQLRHLLYIKKNNALEKGNYRSVSALSCISKIFERAIHDQLMEFL
jgi:hypothetical protein